MKKGFTLIEIIIGVAIFLLIAISVWEGFLKIMEGVNILRVKNISTSIANEQFEIVRNMPYEDVGIVDGLPPGKIPKIKIIERDGKQFQIKSSVLYFDEPFDGKIGELPNDLAPIDTKLVEFVIECVNCMEMKSVTVTSKISPRNLETTGDMGALFIEVVDADGDPVVQADIKVENKQGANNILVDEVTNNQGMLQLVGAPPGVEAYEISVTKTGYSSDKTYKTGELENPLPNKPHANVSAGLVTLITFIIDKLSIVKINTMDNLCSPISSVSFDLFGEKIIGVGVLKHLKELVTNSSGSITLNNIEWDTYDIDLTDNNYFLAGTNPILPFVVNPDSSQELNLILESKKPNALLVNVKDRNGNLPIADAEVTLSKSGFTKIKYSGTGALSQTDWSSGVGQEQIGSLTSYFSQDGNIDDSVSGELKLKQSLGAYYSNGNLISSIFDVGTTTNFHVLNWEPLGQPVETGSNPIKFQVATNEFLTATSTWDFVGPAGPGTYFESSGEPFPSSADNDRYIRYKAFFTTSDTNFSPVLSDVSFSFSTDCSPSGQVYFDDLNLGIYSIKVNKNSYTEYNLNNLNINQDWQKIDVILDPI